MPIPPALAKPYCVDGPTVDASISGQLVKVPVGYRPHISAPGGESFSPVNEEISASCSGELAKRLQEPIEANSVFIFVGTGKAGSDVKPPASQLGSFRLFRNLADRSKDLLEINQFRRLLKKAGRKLEDLPRFGGFYALRREEGKPIFRGPFMAVSEGIKTPAGNPVVVNCSSHRIAAATVQNAPNQGAVCRVAYDLSPNVMVRYSFSGVRIRIDEWEMLDATFREFLAQIIELPDR